MSVTSMYLANVEAGVWGVNHEQRALASHLDELLQEMAQARAADTAWFQRWFPSLFGVRSVYAATPSRGYYIYGSVGTGKTQFLDWFWSFVPARVGRRDHFYAFMQDVHRRIAKVRAKSKSGDEDPIGRVALQMAQQVGVICLDEFFVQDIADAMILSRLFSALLEQGVIVVATSNSAPDQLYENGLQRRRFLPFIELLKERLVVYPLEASTDYRMEAARQSRHSDWHVISAATAKANVSEEDRILDRIWRELESSEPAASLSDVGDANVSKQPSGLDEVETTHVRESRIVPDAVCHEAMRITFRRLCEGAYAASDYVGLVAKYRTCVIDDVEVLTRSKRDIARRFVIFLDVAYEARLRLIISAHGDVTSLFSDPDFPELRRARSRLHALTSLGASAEDTAT